MSRHKLVKAGVAVGFAALWCGLAHADGGAANSEAFSARLSGFNELGALNAETGAILTDGTGTLRLDLNEKSQTASYTLTFSDLSSPATQAHIHFGKVHVPGGIFVWLCQTTAKPSPVGSLTPFCPTPPNKTVSGMITGASIIAPATSPPTSQGITAGVFDVLTEALDSNTAYVNVHTTNFPAGEIRGQIHSDDHQKDHN